MREAPSGTALGVHRTGDPTQTGVACVLRAQVVNAKVTELICGFTIA